MSRRRISRRTFVAATGTASALLAAGCADNPMQDDNETDDGLGGDGDGAGETYTLTVTVEDQDGPVEGATVTVAADGMADGGTGNETGNETDNETAPMDNITNDTTGNDTETGAGDTWEEETGAEGMAEFTDLEDGEYTVSAEADAGSAEETVEIAGGDEELTLTLE